MPFHGRRNDGHGPRSQLEGDEEGRQATVPAAGSAPHVQIMMEWIETLNMAGISGSTPRDVRASSQMVPGMESAADGPDAPQHPAHTLLKILQARETEQKHEARAALADFDRKQWRQWSHSLPQRAARIDRKS